MIERRNQTSHTYNEETADAISGEILSRYVRQFAAFLHRFTDLEKGEP